MYNGGKAMKTLPAGRQKKEFLHTYIKKEDAI
jgi:hypothetical protein